MMLQFRHFIGGETSQSSHESSVIEWALVEGYDLTCAGTRRRGIGYLSWLVLVIIFWKDDLLVVVPTCITY